MSLIDPKTNQFLRKTVFLILYYGGKYDVIKRKLIKICEVFNVDKYNIPKDKDTLQKKA